MGLVTEKLKIKWSTTSRQHYIDLGYNFTKIGDLFEVDVKDLSDGSCNLVQVGCDYCDNVVDMQWRQYLNLRGDTYCCPECIKHRKKTRDENGNLIYVEIPYRNRDWLYNEYIVKDREAKDIAKECGIHQRTLREWISMLDIPNKESKTEGLTKEVLYDLYRVQRKTTKEIGELYNISDSAVLYWLRQYEIPSFSSSETTNYYLYEKGGIEKAREIQSTMENRIKSSCRQRGIAIEDFDGFSTTEQHMARNNTYYKEWIRKVFQRDDYTCQCCGKRGGDLNAHHLYNFAEYEDLRYDVDNGITLCPQCHLVNYPNSFHSIYGERNNTPEQVYEYIKMRQKEAV
jgi:DNA-binding transcriptional MerR regulator